VGLYITQKRRQETHSLCVGVVQHAKKETRDALFVCCNYEVMYCHNYRRYVLSQLPSLVQLTRAAVEKPESS
jgi:hypothetical protein